MSSLPLPLPVSDIITVNVSVASGAIAPRPFNQGLIVGPSNVISTSTRLVQYSSAAAMLAGSPAFTDSDPEYLAALAYFSQNPAPQFVWIGRQGATESYAQAVAACFAANNSWYPVMCCGASDADHLALAAWSSANWEQALYFGSTANGSIPAGLSGPGNIAQQIQTLKYKALISYNTTQSGEYPTNIYAAAALLGLACGLNTGAPNSAFTLNLKSLATIAPELLTQAEFDNITGYDCNTCATFGPYSGYVFNGILESGDFFDQVLDRAMLVNLIQTNLMNLLVTVPKVPQTDAGEHQLIAQVEAACASLAEMGYLGPGVWEGVQILNLAPGQSLPNGYFVQAPSYATQSSGNRAARQAMPISCAIIEAGAVDSVLVNVNVQL